MKNNITILPACRPITHAIGFLKADFHDVISWMTTWFEKLQRTVTCNIGKAESINNSIEGLFPLSTQPTRYLILQTSSEWTAILDNSLRGSDVAGAIGYLSQENKTLGLNIHCSSEQISSGYSISHHTVGFSLYGDKRGTWLNLIRSVRVMKDIGKWTFEEFGEVQPFEEVANYQKIIKRNRLDIELLSKYLEKLNIRLADEAFYGSSFCLLEYEAESQSARFATKGEIEKLFLRSEEIDSEVLSKIVKKYVGG